MPWKKDTTNGALWPVVGGENSPLPDIGNTRSLLLSAMGKISAVVEKKCSGGEPVEPLAVLRLETQAYSSKVPILPGPAARVIESISRVPNMGSDEGGVDAVSSVG